LRQTRNIHFERWSAWLNVCRGDDPRRILVNAGSALVIKPAGRGREATPPFFFTAGPNSLQLKLMRSLEGRSTAPIRAIAHVAGVQARQQTGSDDDDPTLIDEVAVGWP